MLELLFGLFWIGIILFLAILIFLLVKELQKQNKDKNYQRRPRDLTSSSRKSTSVSSHLRQQLLSMVGGERAIVQRLLENIQRKYPGRDELWYLEKAIADLERDRR